MTDDILGGGTGGERGERATGTPNTIYDLSSVLFHALEGGASYDTYIQDAEREGDQELADFFRRVRDEDSMRADEAQRLLAERTPTGDTAAGTRGAASAGGSPRTEDTVGGVQGQHDMAAGPTSPTAGPGRREPEAPLSGTREAGPLGRDEPGGQPERRDREEDKGLLDTVRDDALVGDDEESRSRKGTDRPDRR
jgi:hypothetical protein